MANHRPDLIICRRHFGVKVGHFARNEKSDKYGPYLFHLLLY